MIRGVRTAILRRRADEDGFAMLTVLLALLILSMLGSAVLTQTMASMPQVRHEQNYSASIAAAESGVDDFIARLYDDYNYGVDAATDSSNLALSQFVPVGPGSSSMFSYRVVAASKCTGNPQICLEVAGKANGVVRSVRVGLQPHGFLDAMDMDDYNIVDPALYQPNGWSVAQTTAYCVYHAYDSNPKTGGKGPASQCSGLINYWVTGNVFNGPMESNDDFYICGTPTFNDTVTSGDPYSSRAPYWKDPAGCTDNPKFNGGPIAGQRTVTFPPSIGQMSTFAAVGSSTGCLYTGPTAIQLNGNTMTVVSPDTKSTNPGCVGTNVPLPANGVIYVQDIPGSPDPNAGSCIVKPTWTGDPCNAGDAFVQGTVTNALTIYATNNIFITGNVGSDLVGSNVLGLIAQNGVQINHPTYSGSGPGSQCWSGTCNTHGTVPFYGSTTFSVPIVNPTVKACILALTHAFGVMNFNAGSIGELGTLTFIGSMAGRFMDTEGMFSGQTQVSGYGVNYTYDQRLRGGALVPPHFLAPSKTYYHRVTYAEVPNPPWA